MALSCLARLKTSGLSGFVLVAAIGIATPIASGQNAQTPDEPRITDELRLDDSERRSTTLERGLTPDDDSAERLQPDLRTDTPLRAETPVEARDELVETALPVAAPRRFDLFAGPEQERAEPLGAQNVGPQRATAVGRVSQTRDQAAIAEDDRRIFDPIGPVRPPSLAVTGVEGRLNAATTGLRRSLPVLPDDPFAADGIRVGAFRLFPALEQSVGLSDNTARSPDGESGVFTDTTVSAQLLSQWSRHELELNGAASYRRNFQGPLPEEPRIDVDARLRLDINRDWTATVRGALAYSRESAFSADPLTPVDERPDVLAYSAGADLERAVGRTRLTLTTQAVREEREPVGGTLSSDDFSTYSAGLRAQYEISRSLQPFITASLGRRIFDEDRDLLLRERDSLLPALRLGVGFDRGEKFFGEVAVGYAMNQPDDDSLEETGSPTLDARINWSPRRGTDVVLTASTYFDPADDNLSTSTVYETSLGIRHRALTRLDLTGLLGLSFRDQSIAVDERVFAAEIGATYWIRRGLALTALARHERLQTDLAASEYSANSIRVGVRVQR